MHFVQSICFKTSILAYYPRNQPNNDPCHHHQIKYHDHHHLIFFSMTAFYFHFKLFFCHNSRNWLSPLVIIKILWSPSIKFHVCHRPLAIPVIVACLALRTFSIGSRYKLVQVCLQRNIKINLNLGRKLKAYLHHKLRLKTCLIQNFLSAFKVFYTFLFEVWTKQM